MHEFFPWPMTFFRNVNIFSWYSSRIRESVSKTLKFYRAFYYYVKIAIRTVIIIIFITCRTFYCGVDSVLQYWLVERCLCWPANALSKSVTWHITLIGMAHGTGTDLRIVSLLSSATPTLEPLTISPRWESVMNKFFFSKFWKEKDFFPFCRALFRGKIILSPFRIILSPQHIPVVGTGLKFDMKMAIWRKSYPYI